VLGVLGRNRFAAAGGLIVLCVLVAAIFAPAISPADPNRLDSSIRLTPPGPGHPFGTDRFGRDVLSQVIYGARVSVVVGLASAALATILGTTFGVAAGYYRRLDNIIMRVMDGMMAFPTVLLAIAIMSALGPNLANVIMALGIVYTPRVARVCRSVVLTVRELGYVEAAVAAGSPDPNLVFRHRLPNCLQPVIVQGTFVFAYAILAEASLSFLGLGVPPDVPSWGAIVSEGRNYIQIAPWLTLFPGVTLMLVVMGLNLLGDALRDLVDPQLRKN
jgi:peptide/nickel transport system permease protein